MDGQKLISDLLRRCYYDPERGEFRRRKSRGIPEGQFLGTPESNGKLQATFNGKRYMVHHLVWLVEHGSFPPDGYELYHINGNKSDNRITNLGCRRVVDRPACVKAREEGAKRKEERRRHRELMRLVKKYDPQKAREKVLKDRERNRKRQREYRDRYLAQLRKHHHTNKHNPEYKAARRARAILNQAVEIVRDGRKCGTRTEEALGYTFEEFRKHIERNMEPWMTWENHGKWHIDHVKPLAAFRAEGVMDMSVVNALDNLKPVPAEENLSKSSRYQGVNYRADCLEKK